MPRFDRAPVIDGKLDDEVWKQAVKLKDFYQTSPGDNIAPSQPTEVLLGYDSKFLYVAFHCYDDPSKVRANIAKRDDIFNDDYVGMLLDTFNDHRKAYELDFNPLGVQEDGIWQDPIYNEDFNPDFVMESKGTPTSDGYVVEAAIPFKSLRYEAGKNKPWGVHFYRRIKRINNKFDSWMPIDRAQSGWMTQAANYPHHCLFIANDNHTFEKLNRSGDTNWLLRAFLESGLSSMKMRDALNAAEPLRWIE